jgi:uncharacterized protein YuzE
MKKKLNVFYDQEKDILDIAKDGKEEEFIEIYPGINIELNEKREFIGLEILEASRILKDVIKPIQEKTVKTQNPRLSNKSTI